MKVQKICTYFKWCIEQARELHGAYTGGPYEIPHQKMIDRSTGALKSLENLAKNHKIRATDL